MTIAPKNFNEACRHPAAPGATLDHDAAIEMGGAAPAADEVEVREISLVRGTIVAVRYRWKTLSRPLSLWEGATLLWVR